MRVGLPRVRWRERRTQRRGFQLLCAAALAVLLPTAVVWFQGGPRLRTVADAPAEPVVLVFGAGLDGGKPSPYLAHRLDAAIALYKAGRVHAVLVSGDNSRVSYDEPDAMRTYLVQHGVPADHVVRDYAGFNTWDSCARARRIFGVTRALLVNQGYAIRRAVSLCQAAGIDSYGIGVEEWHDRTWQAGVVREIASMDKAILLDELFQPDPHLLGPDEATSLASAEAAAP
ncbi:SanA/YdcF family protein [Streptacidiphilus jiangxiensis]|uniref:Protein SanA, affects membrane permeability for vancomycin n=1 Tax=Streptacidiphilus jiangxiensis TaxID=235985 RepID=A0A1H7Y8Q9_STRJI|nr:ElyC/SanA/YdcF family protein [Streptacidiphilus jiangxiensis]SEM41579.1 protein SanA, affects membrane permeability for vancomycin [Streptacidiphilus jiangxiensis]